MADQKAKFDASKVLPARLSDYLAHRYIAPTKTLTNATKYNFVGIHAFGDRTATSLDSFLWAVPADAEVVVDFRATLVNPVLTLDAEKRGIFYSGTALVPIK